MLNVNVFALAMKYWILGHRNCAHIVTIKFDGLASVHSQIFK